MSTRQYRKHPHGNRNPGHWKHQRRENAAECESSVEGNCIPSVKSHRAYDHQLLPARTLPWLPNVKVHRARATAVKGYDQALVRGLRCNR
jgi:hypothetical protein